ncbi:hypothetical protein L249_4250, partial [Ophiocordyceps polyrhachis-furcata BCC 54312]
LEQQAIAQSSRLKRKLLPPRSPFDSDKILFLARNIPYNDYARAVTRIRSIAINIKAFRLKARSNAKGAPLTTRALPLNLLPAIRDSLIPAAKQYRHFLKSCNLYLAHRLFISRMRFIDILTRYNVLVRASRRELIIYSADNLVIYGSAAR